MENPQTKRQMYQPLTPQNTNPDIAALSTIGMRIRKSIMDGHPGNSQYSYNPQFGTQSASSQPTPLYQRTPLPSHMSQPPSLTNEGSTFQSGLNVSEWGCPKCACDDFAADGYQKEVQRRARARWWVQWLQAVWRIRRKQRPREQFWLVGGVYPAERCA